MGNEMLDKEAGKPFERQPMNAGAKALLNGTDRTFDFPNVAVGRDHVSDDGKKVGTDTVKFVITEKVGHGKTSVGISCEDGVKGLENGVMVAVGHHGRSTETEVA